jgi:flagellin-like protein
MDLKQLFKDDDAVSPVIGVILMVAITVILAAVIASFVLGLGDSTTDSAPQASFGWEYDGDTNIVTVSHESGASIEAEQLVFRGDNFGSGGDVNSPGQDWTQAPGVGTGSNVNAGMTIDVGVDTDYDISLTYVQPDKEQSTTLASDTGPDA